MRRSIIIAMLLCYVLALPVMATPNVMLDGNL